MIFVNLRKFPSIYSFLRVFFFFYHKWVLNFVKWFSASVDIILCFFLNLLIWWITLTDFQMLNQTFILGSNPTWSWYIILFIHYWVWFANILRIFIPIFILFFLTLKKGDNILSLGPYKKGYRPSLTHRV